MLYELQVCNTVILHLYNLWCDHYNMSSNQVSPHQVIMILLTVLAVLYGASLPLCPSSSQPHPSGNHQLLSVSMSLCLIFVLFVQLFCLVLDSTYQWNHTVFAFVWLTSLHNILYVHTCCCKWQDCILFYGWIIFCLLMGTWVAQVASIPRLL